MLYKNILDTAERENIIQLFFYLKDIWQNESNEAYRALYDLWHIKVSKSLWEYGLYQDYLECGKIVLECAIKAKDINVKNQLLCEMGYVYMEQNEHELARSYFLEAFESYFRENNIEGKCKTIRYLASISLKIKRISDAQMYVAEGLKIVSEQEYFKDKYTFKLNESELYSLQGDIELEKKNLFAAHLYFSIAFRLSLKLDKNADYYQLGHLRSIGKCFHRRYKYKKGIAMYNFCLIKGKEINRLDMVAAVNLDLAKLFLEIGQDDLAQNHLEEAIHLSGDNYPDLLEDAVKLMNNIKAR